MNVLVIGSGGREHALVWKLCQSSHVTRLACAPGNWGIATERTLSGGAVTCHAVGAEDLPGLLDLARRLQPDLTVVGPDNPLALGLSDLFQANGFRIWGPNKRAAQFEASKAFSQAFMERHGIPTARSGVFDDPALAIAFAEELGGRCAVKADGLALGKGVLLTQNPAEAAEAVRSLMVAKAYGMAGSRVVIQELLEGMEVSLHALVDGKTALLFPTSQDHKRALDGDEGPNTGGMGTYSPVPFLNASELQSAADAVLTPWLAGCAAEGIDFRGILYPGIMLTASGPKVLEFNARFGDPETQVYLPRLENDLVELFDACIDQRLSGQALRWKNDPCVCVVIASGGYPASSTKGKVIHGLDAAGALERVKVFHAGTTAGGGGDCVTNGGRVLGVTAWGPTLAQAKDRAYEAVSLIRFEGMQFRTDIAAKGLAAGSGAHK